MIKMYDCKMTAGAVRKLEERAGKKIDKLLEDELKQLLYEKESLKIIPIYRNNRNVFILLFWEWIISKNK